MTSKVDIETRAHAKALEAWYLRAHRKLPWRESHDPYRIWISEVMLQQTQVATVIPYYEKFLRLFPTVEALAKAPEERVLTAWSGLGYYSRAKNLRRGAQFIVDNGGEFPRDRDTILEVPGIGPYTGGAILSIAFDLPVPIVDGNIQRVFARFYAEKGEPTSRAMQTFFWSRAKSWVDVAASPRILNQALMELGATVCTKSSPKCEACPVRSGCVAFQKSLQHLLPVKKKRNDPVDLWWSPLVIEHRGKFFLTRIAKSEWWSDMWDFPRLEFDSEAALEKSLVSRGASLKWTRLSRCKHTVTHHRIHAHPVSWTAPRPAKVSEVTGPVDGSWLSREEIENLPLSALAKKVLRSRDSIVLK